MQNKLDIIIEWLRCDRKMAFKKIEEDVFRGAWNTISYSEIAANKSYDEDYIRQVGADLFKKLSKVLGQPVSKCDFKEVLVYQASTHLIARQQSDTEEHLLLILSEKLEITLQKQYKRILQNAADLTGLTLNDYIIHHALIAARRHLVIARLG